MPQPFWEIHAPGVRPAQGVAVLTAPAYVDGRYNPRAIADAHYGLAAGEPAWSASSTSPRTPAATRPTARSGGPPSKSLVADARLPAAGGHLRRRLRGAGLRATDPARVAVLGAAGAHPNLAAVKVDGAATKEFSFSGGRVGFFTFALDLESDKMRGRSKTCSRPLVARASARVARGARWCCSRPCATRGCARRRDLAAAAEGAEPGAEGSAGGGRSRAPDSALCSTPPAFPGADPGVAGSRRRDRPPTSAGPPRHRPDLDRAFVTSASPTARRTRPPSSELVRRLEHGDRREAGERVRGLPVVDR